MGPRQKPPRRANNHIAIYPSSSPKTHQLQRPSCLSSTEQHKKGKFHHKFLRNNKMIPKVNKHQFKKITWCYNKCATINELILIKHIFTQFEQQKHFLQQVSFTLCFLSRIHTHQWVEYLVQGCLAMQTIGNMDQATFGIGLIPNNR